MRAVDDRGRVIDAEYLVEADGCHLALILESRSGVAGSRAPRNPEYNRELTMLLTRLGRLDAVLADAVVDSRHTRDLGLARGRSQTDPRPDPARPSSLLGDLNRVRRVKAKPLRGRFASLDTSGAVRGMAAARRTGRPRNRQVNDPICKPTCKPDAAKPDGTGETKATRPAVICRICRSHSIRGRLSETAEMCVVRLITQRATACPLRARRGGKRRVLTGSRG